MGIAEILTLIFVILKAFKFINLTWSQCFIPEIIAALLFYFIGITSYIVKRLSHRQNE